MPAFVRSRWSGRNVRELHRHRLLGAGHRFHRLPGLEVYAATGDRLPQRVHPPSAPKGKDRNWCRKKVAEWALQQVASGEPFIAGIDHAFSFPAAYFKRNNISKSDGSWPTFCDIGPRIKIAISSLISEGQPSNGTND